MTKVVAITGGIGSGKSTVSNYLKDLGYKVHDSDKVVSNLYQKQTKNFLRFIKDCGLHKALNGSNMDKTMIADKIFKNKTLKEKIENHIHKEVKKNRDIFLKKNINKKNQIIFNDIPLLFEKNLESHFDLVVCLISTKEVRMKRVLGNKKFTKKIFNNIIKNQTTDKERKKRSDITIYNNTTKKDLILKVKFLLIESLR